MVSAVEFVTSNNAINKLSAGIRAPGNISIQPPPLPHAGVLIYVCACIGRPEISDYGKINKICTPMHEINANKKQERVLFLYNQARNYVPHELDS